MSNTKFDAAASMFAESSCRRVLDEMEAFIYATDREGRYIYANRHVLELIGHPLGAVIGHRFEEFFNLPDDGGERQRLDESVYLHGKTLAQQETNLIQATGELRTYWSEKKPLHDDAGEIVGMIGISHDITDKKRLEDQVREQNGFLDAILDNLDAMVYMKDANRRFLYINRYAAEAMGRPAGEIVGRLDIDLMPIEMADQFWVSDREVLRTGEHQAGEDDFVDSAGAERHFWRVLVPWTQSDGGKAVLGLSTDITELHKLKEDLRRQTVTDALTGIANRRGFYERAEQEFARSTRHGLLLSLISIDLDHFKLINDAYGHRVGDLVLRDFAHCCQRALRSEDMCARTGGEEFCVLLPDTDMDSARALAERIRAVVCACTPDPNHPDLRFTASFGVACLCEGDSSFENLFLRADRALYRAKEEGRNRTCLLPGE